MAQMYANEVCPLLSSAGTALTLQQALGMIPLRPLDFPICPGTDGAGAGSQVDWGAPGAFSQTPLDQLRRQWTDLIFRSRLHEHVWEQVRRGSKECPITEQQLAPFAAVLRDTYPTADWSVPNGQPFRVGLLQCLARTIHFPDLSIFSCLRDGAPTGANDVLQPSGIFPLKSSHETPDLGLAVHFANWSSAEEDPDTLKELVQQELDQGHVFLFPGTLADAREQFGTIGIGRLGIRRQPGKKPRLVFDATISNLNRTVQVPEVCQMPTLADIRGAFPLRNCAEPLQCWCLDVKGAHKLVKVLPSDFGTMGFFVGTDLYFYCNNPFGATQSAWYWARVASLLHRLCHHIATLKHAGAVFVDDSFWMAPLSISPLLCTLMIVMLLLVGCPLNFSKLAGGDSVLWIGWKINVFSGFVELAEDKRQRVLQLIQGVQGRRVQRQALEQLIGLLLWVSGLYRPWRASLGPLYLDLHQPLPTLYSFGPADWPSIRQARSPRIAMSMWDLSWYQ